MDRRVKLRYMTDGWVGKHLGHSAHRAGAHTALMPPGLGHGSTTIRKGGGRPRVMVTLGLGG